MRYLCLLIGEPDVAVPVPGTAEFARLMEDFQTAASAMHKAGVVIDSGPLEQPSAARTLRLRNGKQLVTDGPFAEIKEVIGGYFVLECGSIDEALEWMATLPSPRYGAIEVRPLMRLPGHE